MTNVPVRLIAFYLPQYHPIPENDAWWGAGFTEWTNVRQARPLFPGHYQPHVPAELGYYDLRNPETRVEQARLAREYGVYGFCYYHYWFNGKQLLERPFKEVLASGQPDFPFCLCWANHNWNRAWDGQETHLLVKQSYSNEDDLAHIRWLATAFRDDRYIRVGGKPLFLVYNVSGIPNPVRTTALWREQARQLGIGEIYLCKVESFSDYRSDPTRFGFDAAVEFQPDTKTLLTPLEKIYWRLARRLNMRQGALVCDYGAWVQRALHRPVATYNYYPCVTPSWDNSPRRASGAFILNQATPQVYECWLKSIFARFQPRADEENLVFVNAWNEWGESNHLEPCAKWGRAYLEATRRALAD